MAKDFELSDAMRARIGAESPPWIHEVTSTSVRAFARGVGYTDPVYFDVEAARKAGYPDLPAPPTYLGTPVFLPGRSSDTFSGPVEGRPSVDHGLAGLLDGGTETEYHGRICAGDRLGVVLGKGAHRVVLRHRARGLGIGLALALLGAVGLVLVAARERLRRGSDPPGGSQV